MADSDSSARLSRRVAVIGGAILVAFLLGFFVQFRATQQARSSLKAVEAEAARLRAEAEQAELRDLAALTLFEVTQRNFGAASQHSTALFDRLQQAAAGGAAGAGLGRALSARDRMTAGLASADPAVLADVQQVFRLVFDATRGK